MPIPVIAIILSLILIVVCMLVVHFKKLYFIKKEPLINDLAKKTSFVIKESGHYEIWGDYLSNKPPAHANYLFSLEKVYAEVNQPRLIRAKTKQKIECSIPDLAVYKRKYRVGSWNYRNYHRKLYLLELEKGTYYFKKSAAFNKLASHDAIDYQPIPDSNSPIAINYSLKKQESEVSKKLLRVVVGTLIVTLLVSLVFAFIY